MPQNQSNIPGVYKPTSDPEYIGLENRLHTPINTKSFADLFKIGFNKKALESMFGDYPVSDKDLDEYIDKILGRVEKGDAPGGLVAYYFPDTKIKTQEGDDTYMRGGNYIPALETAIGSFVKNRPKFEGEEYFIKDGQRFLRMPETPEVENWVSKLESLKEMQRTSPDTFNIFQQHSYEKDIIESGKSQENTFPGVKLARDNLLSTLLHEPLHSVFHHGKEGEYKEYEKQKGFSEGQRVGFPQESYARATNVMRENILNEMSEKELTEYIYNLLFQNKGKSPE
tara:strand:+ start:46 stop:894 length:849 start_codon:yes stop_codon:yes gene_type:complete